MFSIDSRLRGNDGSFSNFMARISVYQNRSGTTQHETFAKLLRVAITLADDSILKSHVQYRFPPARE